MVRLRSLPALACLAVLAIVPADADDAMLQGAAAWQKLVGNTVVARTGTGASYTDYYAPDGTVRHQDGDGATTGTWKQNGDAVCFDYPDDDDSVCLKLEVTGTAGSFTDSGGATDTFAILPGNAKGL
jgi:hypothetical protein